MLRIGSGEGYYGDDILRSLPMIEGGYADVVCFEALSELTLAILRRQAMRDPKRGYTRDVELLARAVLPRALERNVPLVTNAGGLNPRRAAEKMLAVAQEQGLSLRIAVVTGDDVVDRIAEFRANGDTLEHLETGAAFDWQAPVLSANVYLGAQPIADALAQGADVVITGRVADPSLYLAPIVEHFSWAWDDWDRLAAGTVCGHLLECTAQVVGGNSLVSLDRLSGEDLANLGYPIAEVESDGSFVLTKTPGMPGIITSQTVKEQLLYEVHDPGGYITPDVVVDLRSACVESVGENRIRVSGIRGRPRTATHKLLIAREDGYARELIFRVGSVHAEAKASQLEAMLAAAWRDVPLRRVFFERLGGGDEILVRAAFSAERREALDLAVRKALALGLSGPAGMVVLPALINAPERALLALWPTLLRRERVVPHVEILEAAHGAGR